MHWPSMNPEIEDKINNCSKCEDYKTEAIFQTSHTHKLKLTSLFFRAETTFWQWTTSQSSLKWMSREHVH